MARCRRIALWLILKGKLVVHFPRGMSWKPDWVIIRQLFKFGLPTGIQGVAMNVAGVLLLRFMGSLPHSAETQAAYAVGYAELFSLITWTSVGLMGAAATVAGQNLGAGHPDRSERAVHLAARVGLCVAAFVGALFLLIPDHLLAIFGLTDPDVVRLGTQLLRFLSVSGLFVTVALTYTGGLQGTGDTRSPLVITLISQVLVPLGILLHRAGLLHAAVRRPSGAPSSPVISLGASSRSPGSSRGGGGRSRSTSSRWRTTCRGEMRRLKDEMDTR